MPNEFSIYDDEISGDIEDKLEWSPATLITGYADSGVDYMIFATASGITSLKRSQSSGATSKTGYFSQANINAMDYDDTYLYVATGADDTNGNIGRISLASLFSNGDSDRGADYTSNWGTSTLSGFSSNNYRVGSVSVVKISSNNKYFLAYCIKGAPDQIIGIYNLTDGTGEYYFVSNKSNSEIRKLKLTTEGALYGISGAVVMYIEDILSISANDFWWDEAFGNLDNDFSIAGTKSYMTMGQGGNSTAAISVSGGSLNRDATANSVDSYAHVRGGPISSDFDLRITGLAGGGEPAISGAGELWREFQIVKSDNTDSAMIRYRRYYNSSTSQVEMQIYSRIVYGGTEKAGATYDIGAGIPGAGWKFRIARSGTTVTLYYDIGAGWVSHGTWTGWDHNPAKIMMNMYTKNLSGADYSWYVSDIQNADPETMYSEFPGTSDISDIDVMPSGTGNVPFVGLAYENQGAAIVELDEADLQSSSVTTYGVTGKDQNILTSDSCNCVALNIEGEFATEPDIAWIGTDNAGIDRVDFVINNGDNANTDYGKTINEKISSIVAFESCGYATGSPASGNEGGGWISSSFMEVPHDTEVAARVWMDSEGKINVAIAFFKDDAADWDHCRLYRSKDNGASWYFLKDDGAWATSGSYYEFKGPTSDGEFSWNDIDLSDGAYLYKVTQVDSGSNESAGASTVEYVDEPIVSLSIKGGAPSTTEKGLELSLSGNSGNDSGNVADKVFAIEIKEDGQSWSEGIVYKIDGSSPWIAPFHLPPGAGMKTIKARGIDSAGRAGPVDTASIVLETEEESQTAYDSTDNIMVAYDFRSDDLAFSCSQSDIDFPVENIQDPRLSLVWRGEVINTGGDTDKYYLIATDFGASFSENINVFFLANHNFDSGMLSDAKVYLCGYNGASMPVWNGVAWIGNADEVIDLSGIIGKSMICHRPEMNYRFWAVVFHLTAKTNATSLVYQPYIGRVGFVRSSDIWQPKSNFNFNFEQEIKDQSIIHESDDQTFESINRDKRGYYRFGFPQMFPSDFRTAKTIFEKAGLTGDILVLPKPSDFALGQTAPSSSDQWLFDPIYCQMTSNLRLRGEAGGRVSFDLELREIIGGRAPYGMSTS